MEVLKGRVQPVCHILPTQTNTKPMSIKGKEERLENAARAWEMAAKAWNTWIILCSVFSLILVTVGCGSDLEETPQTESVSSVSDGVVCDRFELRWELDGEHLLLSVDTDSPDETELSVSVGRSYYEVGNDTEYSRDYLSVFEPVAKWREPRRISLDANAWQEDLAAHQISMAGIPELAFEVARIDNNVEIRAVLHMNQDDPRFGGKGNPNLSGTAVSLSGNGKIVEAEASFEFPLEQVPNTPEAPTSSSTGSTVEHDKLQVGEIYVLSEGAPLMPELEPADPLAAIGRMMELGPGATIMVMGIDHQTRISPWYLVIGGDDLEGDTYSGWINSIALMG